MATARTFVRRTVAAFALACSLAVAPTAFAGNFDDADLVEAADHSDLTVVESALAHRIEDRKPVDAATAFAPGDKIVAYVQVKNPGADSHVTVTWAKDGKRVWDIDLEVGHSSRGWRTWARKTVRSGDVGQWTATISAPDGTVLETLSFEVVGEPAARLGQADADTEFLGWLGHVETGC